VQTHNVIVAIDFCCRCSGRFETGQRGFLLNRRKRPYLDPYHRAGLRCRIACGSIEGLVSSEPVNAGVLKNSRICNTFKFR